MAARLDATGRVCECFYCVRGMYDVCEDVAQDRDARGEDSLAQDGYDFDDLDVGVCAWGSGAYGIVGRVHVAVNPDGEREECCTFA